MKILISTLADLVTFTELIGGAYSYNHGAERMKSALLKSLIGKGNFMEAIDYEDMWVISNPSYYLETTIETFFRREADASNIASFVKSLCSEVESHNMKLCTLFIETWAKQSGLYIGIVKNDLCYGLIIESPVDSGDVDYIYELLNITAEDTISMEEFNNTYGTHAAKEAVGDGVSFEDSEDLPDSNGMLIT